MKITASLHGPNGALGKTIRVDLTKRVSGPPLVVGVLETIDVDPLGGSPIHAYKILVRLPVDATDRRRALHAIGVNSVTSWGLILKAAA